MEGPLCGSPQRKCHDIFPPIVVPGDSASREADPPPLPKQCQPKNIIPLPPSRRPQLFRASLCAHWHGDIYPRQATQAKKMGGKCNKRVGTRYITRALQVLAHSHIKNIRNKNFGHCVLQTQMPHQPHSHPSRRYHGSRPRHGRANQRPHGPPPRRRETPGPREPPNHLRGGRKLKRHHKQRHLKYLRQRKAKD